MGDKSEKGKAKEQKQKAVKAAGEAIRKHDKQDNGRAEPLKCPATIILTGRRQL
jgi:hypothetical protein